MPKSNSRWKRGNIRYNKRQRQALQKFIEPFGFFRGARINSKGN